MSYILDALRKSDQQRKRGTVPSLPAISHVAPLPAGAGFLRYALVGMLLLAVGMLIGWLRPWAQPGTDSVSVAPVTLSPPPNLAISVLAAPREAAPPQPAPTALAAALPVPMPAPAPRPKAGSVDRPPLPSAAPLPPALADLPPALQQALPPMEVSMHVYAAKATQRLVSINKLLLQEGDFLSPELKLEQITPTGMIFSYRGQRFRRGVKAGD